MEFTIHVEVSPVSSREIADVAAAVHTAVVNLRDVALENGISVEEDFSPNIDDDIEE